MRKLALAALNQGASPLTELPVRRRRFQKGLSSNDFSVTGFLRTPVKENDCSAQHSIHSTSRSVLGNALGLNGDSRDHETANRAARNASTEKQHFVIKTDGAV